MVIAVFIGFGLAQSGLTIARYSVSTGVRNIILGLLLVAIGLSPLLLRRLNTITQPGVLNYMSTEFLQAREHGVPGASLSLGRFGDRARLGQIGEQRTAQLIRQQLLPVFPSLRVVHGLQWPGSQHADLDHALVAGRLIFIVDSKFWQAEHLWWDGDDLYMDGEQQRVTMAAAIQNLAATIPEAQVYGLVTVHSSKSEAP
ncbi:MAG: nuclease-related domain-containing protein, partial [Propionibacteriaceae bacterium]